MKNFRIIIVEDEYRIRTGLERFVSNLQHCEVIGTYANGQEVLDHWNADKPADLVLTDIKMPIMDGMTLIHVLKEAGYAGDFLVLSGFDDFHYVQQALRNKVADYFLKPVDREQLKERLLQLFEKHLEREQKQKAKSQKREQLQLLRSLSGESSLADTQWTELFPQGSYYTCRLQLVDFHQQKAKRDPVRFHQELSTVVMLLEDELSKRWSESGSWWWWDQEQSFGLLVYTHDESKKDIDHLAKALSHRSIFELAASPGQLVQELVMLPAVLESEQMEMKLMPEKQYGESIGACNQVTLQKLRLAFKQFSFDEMDAILYSLEKEMSAERQQVILTLYQSAGIEMLHDASKRLPVAHINSMLQKLSGNLSGSLTVPELVQAFENWTKELASICIRLYRHRENTAIEQAKGFIYHHLKDALTIEQVAAYVYMNPTYFCAYFKKHTGETVLQYVTKQRLDLAKHLLEDSDDKVIAIADAVGYQDHKYFSRLFKKHTGLSPSEYRRNSR